MDTDFYKKLEEERQQREQATPSPAIPVPSAAAVPTPTAAITEETTPAIKFDNDKPRYDLIPPEALDGLARLYGLGAGKYDDRNWEKGLAWSRVFAAMMRHAWKWFRGEDYDREDGQHHLLSVIWCAMALYTYFVRAVGTDDRSPHVTTAVTYDVVWRVPPEATSPKALN